ncbi:metallophosphoesterase [Cytophagaceae bacterium YF14B1]|uniref:Metallophosphoesterase n=1 Tax=Xanthocytophaga flava TaxID=3048013 RepID=A0AAE3UAF9_9BACT|nr:metallophosphoesterase [Xanthocytophaga flavus]MDJ1485521.1 metallophosphoesterase [Xanthocytophaga flavus]
MKRHLIIGDIHGCYEELLQLIKIAGITEEDMIVAVGDIIDRGPDSVKVYDFFRNRPNSKVVMGNHERKHLNKVLHYGQEIVKLQFGDRYQEFLDWAEQLDYYYEIPEAIVVHGGFENGILLEEQKQEVLCASTAGEKHLIKCYGTEQYWPEFYTGSKPIIFGHHVVGEEAHIWPTNVYGIDTGACHGMRLTGILLPEFKIYSVPASCDYWDVERYKWQLPVLQHKTWSGFTFRKIEEELEPFRNSPRADVTDFVQKMDKWIASLLVKTPEMLNSIQQKAVALEHEHRENVNRVTHQLFYSSLIFAARKGSLNDQTLQQTLTTPEKWIQLANELQIPVPTYESIVN